NWQWCCNVVVPSSSRDGTPGLFLLSQTQLGDTHSNTFDFFSTKGTTRS
ncbi:hypothetical protein A2U01_0101697, partial [Trifolium medium]|nr:hypothetical protein [Trifolium medium]